MRIIPPVTPLTRRQMLLQCANGFGALAAAALLQDRAYGAPLRPAAAGEGRGLPHYPPKAQSVIFLYMDGAPSQVDTFDPKPRLDREHGQPIKMKIPATQFDNVGNVLKSPWKFERHGESGAPVSALFPHLAGCVDDIAFIKSMVSAFSEHTNANYFLHTGHGQQGRPSMGSWITYGLGSPSRDLPVDGGWFPRVSGGRGGDAAGSGSEEVGGAGGSGSRRWRRAC